MNREEQIEQQLKKCRKEVTKDFMDFIAQFEVKDADYLFLELRYLSKVVELFNKRLVDNENSVKRIYGDMENKNEQ